MIRKIHTLNRSRNRFDRSGIFVGEENIHLSMRIPPTFNSSFGSSKSICEYQKVFSTAIFAQETFIQVLSVPLRNPLLFPKIFSMEKI
jgi:hypothetical protein